jgi:hypothetical protein
LSEKAFFYHLKLFHKSMKKFCCGENKCFRIFSSIDAFKRHVRSHVLPLDKAKISNEQLTVVQNTDNGDTFENPIVNLNSAIPSYHEPVSFNITEFQDELHSNIIHFISEMYNNQCPDEIVPYKSTSTTLRNPSLAHKHDSAGSLLLKANQLNRVYVRARDYAKLYWSTYPVLFRPDTDNNSLIPRNFIQFIISEVKKIFCDKTIPHLKNITTHLMKNSNCSQKDIETITKLFEICESILKDLDTDYKRFQFYKKKCQEYVPSNDFLIGYKNTYKKTGTKPTEYTSTPIIGKIIPLRTVFKALFEKTGVYEAVMNNIETIKISQTFVNFIQGKLWKQKSQEYEIENKIVFPMFLFFDDYQIGNTLGSHSDSNKLGAVYVSIPCFPDDLFCSLRNIFLFALFYSKDRKKFGNAAVFSSVINELTFLQEHGINITVNNRDIKIYFKLGLIIGDNLGIHTILGFTESFSCNHYCRFCKISKNDAQTSFKNVSNLRTQDSYQTDLALNDISSTGIKESCVWHNLPGFDVTSNFMVDLMHDFLEGICIYDVTVLLRILILEYKLFTIQMLNERIKSFDFGKENSNKPPLINADNLKSKIKMSANEMLCFVRYLGLIIGDFVPENLEIWKLWVKLRTILDIILSSSLHFSEGCRLNLEIEEYLQMVIFYYKKLKPKHHNTLHYSMVFDVSGPLVQLWCMRFEQKHGESKLSSNVAGSYKNMIHTLANKALLKLYHQLTSPFKKKMCV